MSTNATLVKLLAMLADKQNPAPKGRRGRKVASAKPTAADYSAQTVAAFAKAGFPNVSPKVDVKSYRLWMAEGRQVIPGLHGVKVGPFTLFHVSQTQPVAGGAAAAQPKAETTQAKPVTVVTGITDQMIQDYLDRKAAEAALKAEYGQ